MAKKTVKEEKISIEQALASDVPAGEKKVLVEMTEAQKDKFVADMAKEEVKVVLELADVELRFSHSRNGIVYGPGMVRNIDAGIASSLYAADYNAYLSRIKENESVEKNIHILSRGNTTISEVKKG